MHCLQRGQAKALVQRGEEHELGSSVERRELLLEMERERAKARDRAARQRKELDLELDPSGP